MTETGTDVLGSAFKPTFSNEPDTLLTSASLTSTLNDFQTRSEARLDKTLSGIEAKLSSIEARLSGIDAIESTVKRLERSNKKLKMTLRAIQSAPLPTSSTAPRPAYAVEIGSVSRPTWGRRSIYG